MSPSSRCFARRSRTRRADEEDRRHLDVLAAAPERSGARVRKGAIYLAQGPTLPAGAALAVTCPGCRTTAPGPANCAGAGRPDARRRVLGGRAAPDARGERSASQTAQRQTRENLRRARPARQQRRSGGIDAAKYAERRPALMAQLERVSRPRHRGAIAPSRERRLPRSLHPRAQPELRAPGVIARIARLPRGEIVGLLGPNGGQINALAILSTLAAASSGSVVRRPHGE